jgi:hypothetical protein
MSICHRKLCLLLLCFSVLSFAGNGISQTKRAKNLTRDDVVIKPNKASIYICVDRKLWKNKEGGSDLLWLRVHNNTIWTIRFRAERTGTSQKLLKLSNGKITPGLTNHSTAFPRYEFEPKKFGEQLSGPSWGDSGTANWLPTNTSSLFTVPAKYFKVGTLFLEYKYEWEFTGTIADESHGPAHKIYFDIADISDISGHFCD